MLASGLLVHTPRHPKWRFHLLGVSIHLFGHGLAAAAAPGHGQVALGTKKVARNLGPRVQDLRHFLRPQRHLAMAWRRRRRQAMAK